jgi:hypothetical protein
VTSFTRVFGGQTVRPADVSYLALTLTDGDVSLEWPLEAPLSTDLVSMITDVDAQQAGRSVALPDAEQGSTGSLMIFNGMGAESFQLTDSTGATLAVVTAGTCWVLYLTDNSTAAGTWRVFQMGASVSQAQAATLAGNGLLAIGATLNLNLPVSGVVTDGITLSASSRAGVYRWDGGAGAVNIAAVSGLGNGWVVGLRNDGSGTWTITPNGADKVDGQATLQLQPGDSCWLVTDGDSSMYTLGLGQASVTGFDYTSINVAGAGDYVLAGSEVNRIAYKFTGALTGDRTIIVPATVQQYWVNNATTGAFNFYVKTAAQALPGVQVVQNERSILYCDGTDVIDGDTGGISVPIAISQGGTGATTASGARTNLGATAIGNTVFTTPDGATARAALGSTTVGDAVFIAANQAAAQAAIGLGPPETDNNILANQVFGR